MEDRVDGEGQKGERDVAGVEPDEGHEEILHVLVHQKRERGRLWRAAAGLSTSAESLVHYDPVRRCSRDECRAVAEAGPSGGGVEGNVGEPVAQGAGEKGQVANKPAESEGIGQLKDLGRHDKDLHGTVTVI